ncbi:MAG TPA: CCA tRNA nucleotidyltransferase [Syntrophales bacterium]|nr:CCA tRNA nucleotidyltransferase [Syntrophales bacterium]HOM07303.1 CCA tRNA nucleotidyltransferase [Syntrophales bacterium]HOO00176.1 CCA tRNA nucleotidyltransferase [Syntrophales bacterium]HPC01315.1 CCA tRNA nucleotidyltransferase [Syntrophales bacterium]HPQ06852.1 CCA tRNA nucleotidyltransferase [Syntrophales bacterium]
MTSARAEALIVSPPEDSAAYAGAVRIVETLRRSGHEAYLVGGCVRDLVMGSVPDDYDIVTSARPQEVMDLFERTVPVGAAFGVVLVVAGAKGYQVATYRSDGPYADGRHPVGITYGGVHEDVRRRDFTINGLLMDPGTGRVIDLVGGLGDIRNRRVKTIGDPRLRFAEDRLRMLRAVRFAATLDFFLDPEAVAAIREEAPLIRGISAERIREELTKILTRRGLRRGMELMMETGLLEEILPEVAALSGVGQPPDYHPEGDVWEHTLRMLDLMPQHAGPAWEATLAWAVLLHDVGKAVTLHRDERGVHFYGHDRIGARMAQEIMGRLRFSNAETEAVLDLIANHMRFIHVREMKTTTLKRFLRMPRFDLHLKLHLLDCLGSHGNLENYEYCLSMLREMPPETLSPPRLLTGMDLQDMGFLPGPLFKEILGAVEEAQLEGRVSTAEEARRFVLEHFGDQRRTPP